MGDLGEPADRYYSQQARVRQGAGALITADDGRIVMIDTAYRDFYEIPGGAVEVGESAPDACARECREELGIAVVVGRLLALEHQSDGDERGDSVMFVYDGGSVAAEDLVRRSPDPEVAAIVLVEPADLNSVTRHVTRSSQRAIRGSNTASRIAATSHTPASATVVFHASIEKPSSSSV